MELYLVQHGEAKKEQEDPNRPLTDRGRHEVEGVARAAAHLGLGVPLISHSGKLRAQQTAEILARFLAPRMGVAAMAGLGPNEPPAAAEQALARATEPCMLVGHLPHLSRLTSLLVLGDPDEEIVAFRMGAVVCLSHEQDRWRVRWILTPEMAGGG